MINEFLRISGTFEPLCQWVYIKFACHACMSEHDQSLSSEWTKNKQAKWTSGPRLIFHIRFEVEEDVEFLPAVLTINLRHKVKLMDMLRRMYMAKQLFSGSRQVIRNCIHSIIWLTDRSLFHFPSLCRINKEFMLICSSSFASIIQISFFFFALLYYSIIQHFWIDHL